MFLPPLAELLANCQVVALPLVGNFRSLKRRTAVLFEGPSGFGEFAPFVDHSVAHAANWLAAAIEQAYGMWPETSKKSVKVNGILPELAAADIGFASQRLFREFGIHHIKIKSAPTLEADILHLNEIVKAFEKLDAEVQLRLDVNGRWDLTTAIQNSIELKNRFPQLQYLEQPVASLADINRLKSEVEIPIALDENIRLNSAAEIDFIEVNRLADYVVLKAIPLGGVNPALEITKQIEVPIVVSGSLDTNVGLAAGLQLAALVGDQPAGLATDTLFAARISSNPQQIHNGEIEVRRAKPDLISQHLVDTSETTEWQNRLIAAYKHLEQS